MAEEFPAEDRSSSPDAIGQALPESGEYLDTEIVEDQSTILESALQLRYSLRSQPTSIKSPSVVASARPANRPRRNPLILYYRGNSADAATTQLSRTLSKLFDQYRESSSGDRIGIEGAQKYLNDIQVDLDEIAHLALCELLQCPSIGEFERESFIAGWKRVSTQEKYDSTSRQAAYMSTIRKQLNNDPAYFKQIYRNSFKYAKPESQKSVPMDSAIEFWNMFFGKGKGGMEWNTSTTKWLDLWCEFYETHGKRPVTKDLWNMVFELAIKIKEPQGESLEWWQEDGAWPMTIDDFVNSVKKKKSNETDAMDTS